MGKYTTKTSGSHCCDPGCFRLILRNIYQQNETESISVKPVGPSVLFGEGAHWDASAQALFFVSTLGDTIHKYTPLTETHTSAELNGIPTFIIPIEGHPQHYVVGLDDRVVEIQWSGFPDSTAKEVNTVVAKGTVEKDQKRYDKGKADPRGRVFVGAMPIDIDIDETSRNGSLYRIDADGSLHQVISAVDMTNGLSWDVKEMAFYFADSFQNKIWRYDYDIDTGDISNPRSVFELSEHGLAGIVDAMTIDIDGNLWVANFDGYQVLKIDPRRNQLLQKVSVPGRQITSCTFGGPNSDILYMTSIAKNKQGPQPPPHGSLYAITGLGVKGYTNVSAKINMKLVAKLDDDDKF
ncbi:regucalcin-like [Hyposmocoma kahamanoa]|uniref:regucalcin-like n=1 Tax=Hyposmocoma kahamanoa TaxID=1477025 RepID=UPI000E6D5DC7|nr:regucalcin-like [Hyposmocoma kahamanoa]